MNELDALCSFLRRAIKPARRERLIGFAQKPKTRRKLLEAIYHDLERAIDRSATVQFLPESRLDAPAYCFSPPSTFGEHIPSLREIVGSTEVLAVARDASAAYYCPESYVDSGVFFNWLRSPEK